MTSVLLLCDFFDFDKPLLNAILGLIIIMQYVGFVFHFTFNVARSTAIKLDV
jgi:Fe2+ transport system protein B